MFYHRNPECFCDLKAYKVDHYVVWLHPQASKPHGAHTNLAAYCQLLADLIWQEPGRGSAAPVVCGVLQVCVCVCVLSN